MNLGLMLVVVPVMLGGCAANHPGADGVDLVFIGTVKSIEAAPLPKSLANWVVTFQVDKVKSGSLTGKTFSFRIHSAVKSGLEIGGQYAVEARRTKTGYQVDQYQWRKGTHNQAIQATPEAGRP